VTDPTPTEIETLLRVMREPTEAMLIAAYKVEDAGGDPVRADPAHFARLNPWFCEETTAKWHAMFDAFVPTLLAHIRAQTEAARESCEIALCVLSLLEPGVAPDMRDVGLAIDGLSATLAAIAALSVEAPDQALGGEG
jgi:hypothetical protein